MEAIFTILALVFAAWCILRLPPVRAWREECRRKKAEAAYRVTAEALKASGRTREEIRQSLCESGGLEGVAPYFGITPGEIEECRRARRKFKAEMARKIGNFSKYLESLKTEKTHGA